MIERKVKRKTNNEIFMESLFITAGL